MRNLSVIFKLQNRFTWRYCLCCHAAIAVCFLGLMVSWGIATPESIVEQTDGSIRSRMVWRGIRLVDGLAATGSISFRAAKFRFNTWGVVDLEKGRAQELDFTLEYPVLSGNWGSLMTGITWTMSRTRQDTGEIYAALNPVYLPHQVVDLSLEGRMDIRAGKGAWLSTTIGRPIRRLSRENTRCVRIEATLGASIGNKYLGEINHRHAVTGPFSGEVQASLTQLISQRRGRWSLEPVVAVAFPLSQPGRSVLRSRNGGHSVTPWFGISLIRHKPYW